MCISTIAPTSPVPTPYPVQISPQFLPQFKQLSWPTPTSHVRHRGVIACHTVELVSVCNCFVIRLEQDLFRLVDKKILNHGTGGLVYLPLQVAFLCRAVFAHEMRRGRGCIGANINKSIHHAVDAHSVDRFFIITNRIGFTPNRCLFASVFLLGKHLHRTCNVPDLSVVTPVIWGLTSRPWRRNQGWHDVATAHR